MPTTTSKTMSTSEVFTTLDTVLRLSSYSKIRRTFNFSNWYSGFKFSTNLSRSNLVQALFYADPNRDPESQLEFYKSHIKGIFAYLQYYFEATGQLKETKNNCYDMILQSRSDKVTIRFRYIKKIITTDREEETNVNKGQRYEREMINKMRGLGYTTQNKPEEGEDKSDLVLNINGITAKVELKTKGAAYGSGTVEWTGNSWRLKKSERSKLNPNFAKILDSNRILSKLSNDWTSYEYTPNERATKEDQQILGEVIYPIDAQYIRMYYKNSDYLNFENVGLYRLSDEDPLNLGVPLFKPMDCFVRARVQYKKKQTYRYAVELFANQINSSPIHLDQGDLSFLENINN